MVTKQTAKRIFSLFLALVMLCTMQGLTAGAQTVKAAGVQAQAGDTISTGDIIYFGSYPQTEVTGIALTDSVIGAEYDSNGDAEVDGVKYRRIKATVYVTDAEYEQYVSDNYPEGVESWERDEVLAECEEVKKEREGQWRYFKWEPVRWKVLANEGSTLFVMAEKVLDAQDYYNYRDGVGEALWKECTLRKWMNTDADGFYHTAFNSDEQEAIKVNAGNPEGDRIYLLSDEEVKNTEYGFENTDEASDSRMMTASAYAAAKGAAVYSGSILSCTWFLRTPGKWQYVKNIAFNGKIYDNIAIYHTGYSHNPYALRYERTFNGCVPVMHIDSSSALYDTEAGLIAKAATQAVSELEGYKSDVTYRDAEKAKREEAIESGIAKINSASDVESINKALAAAKAAIDKLKTDEELTAAEEKVLEEAKTTAKSNLDKKLEDLDNYREEEQKELKKAVEDGLAAIEAAADKAVVEEALANALAVIDNIPTKADIEQAEALVSAKEEAVSRLEEYLGDISGYNSEQQAALQAALDAGKEAIDQAKTASGVNSALAKAKRAIDEIRKQAESEEEAQKLAAAKAEAVSRLEEYLGDVSGYNLEQQAALQAALDAGKEAIDQAKTASGVDSALANAKGEIDEILKQAESEEEAQKLAAAKKEAKEKLKQHADSLLEKNIYREEEQAKFNQDVLDGYLNIDNAKDEASIQRSLNWTIERLDSIKTKEELEAAEQLTAAKTAAKEELESYKQDRKTASNETTWDLFIKNYKIKLDAAENETAVQTVLAEAKAKIDQIISGGIVMTEEEQKLFECRSDALAELKAYQNGNIREEDYDNSGLLDIRRINAEAQAAIDNAADEEEVKAALEKALKDLANVKTTAQKQEENEVAAKRLAEAKAAAEAELNKYLENLDAYRSKQQTELKNAVNTGIKSINSAVNENQLKARLETAKAKVEAIKTDEQLTADELEAELAKAKKDAKSELGNYKNAKNYRTAQKKELENAIKAGKEAIDAAKDKEAVAAALKTAKADIDKIKTDAQLKKEEASKKPTDISKKGKVVLSTSSYTYDGKAKTPDATVSLDGKTLVKDTDYTVAYQNNKEVGTASVVVTGKGNYTGKLTKKFEIVPKGTSISGKIKAQKKGFTVKWKKQTKLVDGYDICYSTSKKFVPKETRYKLVKKSKTQKLTVKRLKAKKKYYVRIRTYKTVKGKRYYSAWSKAKTVKTKK